MKYREAPEVKEIAKALIEKYHPHLRSSSIAYIFQDKASKVSGGAFTILGTARKTSQLDRSLHGYDFIIVIAEDQWNKQNDPKKKEMLIDHELCHCWYRELKNGSTEWIIRDHDVKEFREIIRRYKLNEEGIEIIESE